MGNVLSGEKREQVLALGRLGWSLRRIEQAMRGGDPGEAIAGYIRAKLDYSGRRVDFVDRDLVIQDAMNNISDKAFADQWFELIAKHRCTYATGVPTQLALMIPESQ